MLRPAQRLIAAWSGRGGRLRRLPRALQAAGFLTLLLGIGGAWRVYEYTEHDPSFCKSCHVMQDAWDRWAVSEHQDVGCHACHQQSKLRSLQQVWLNLVERPEQVEAHAEVPDGICMSCHGNGGNPRWERVAATAGHNVHWAEQGIDCLTCHADGIHRFQVPADVCQSCHTEQHMEVAEMGRLHCTSCHNFLADSAGMLPTRSDCLWCHQQQLSARVVFEPKSPMQFECQSCHTPHQQQSPGDSCASCHAEVTAVATRPGTPEPHRDCGSCHAPHTWTTQGDETCRSCHGALPESEVHRDGHRTLRCGTCHQPHAWSVPAEGLCRTCHRRAGT